MSNGRMPQAKTCTIVMDLLDGVPTFTLSAAEPEVLVIQINLWREGVESPQWSIVVDNPSKFFDASGYRSPEDAMRAAFEKGVRDLLSGVGSLPLRRVRYGEVPAGFLQSPRSGPAPVLQPGRHHISVGGGHSGWLTFDLP